MRCRALTVGNNVGGVRLVRYNIVKYKIREKREVEKNGEMELKLETTSGNKILVNSGNRKWRYNSV